MLLFVDAFLWIYMSIKNEDFTLFPFFYIAIALGGFSLTLKCDNCGYRVTAILPDHFGLGRPLFGPTFPDKCKKCGKPFE